MSSLAVYPSTHMSLGILYTLNMKTIMISLKPDRILTTNIPILMKKRSFFDSLVTSFHIQRDTLTNTILNHAQASMLRQKRISMRFDAYWIVYIA